MNISKNLIEKLLIESASFREVACEILFNYKTKQEQTFSGFEKELLEVFARDGQVAAMRWLRDFSINVEIKEYFLRKYDHSTVIKLAEDGRFTLGFARFVVRDLTK